MKILIVNGPNLNMLGHRDENHYGNVTLDDIQKNLVKIAEDNAATLEFYQSNIEGDIINEVQSKKNDIDGILINAGAFSHYSLAIQDALSDSKLPVVTVHLSNIYSREEERHTDLISPVAVGGVYGFREESYEFGLRALISYVKKHNTGGDGGRG